MAGHALTCYLFVNIFVLSSLDSDNEVLQRLNLPIFLTIAGGLGVGQAAERASA